MHRCGHAILITVLFATAGMARAQPDFGAAALAIEPIDGAVSLAGLRAWVWDEGDVRRAVLDRDVRLILAGYDLEADRAAVWIAPRADLGPETVQLFVYAEGVDTPNADAAVAVTAETLSIQGVLRLISPVELRSDGVIREPTATAFVDRAAVSLASFLSLAAGGDAPPALADAPRPSLPVEVPSDRGARAQAERAVADDRADAGPIIESRGVLTLAAETVVRTASEDRPAVVLTGGVSATYSVPGERRTMELTAERAVVFLRSERDPGTLAIAAGEIDGIYLEGSVIATDGSYTLRGPRVFYDLAADRAIVLDAVFSTFDQRRGFPLYVRAESIRQISRSEFVADRARLSNTAFARPNISLGARTVNLTRRPERADDPEGPAQTVLDAEHITLNAGTIPGAYLPRFRGDPERIPLRDIRFVNATDSGGEIRTRWDAVTLLGLESRDDLDVNLLADALLERGPGLGLTAEWNTPTHRGGLLTYWVLNDTGTDVLTTGARVDRTGDTRGIVRAEDVTTLDSRWTLFTELAYTTDVNAIDSFYPDLAETGREPQTRARLRRLEGNEVFTIEATGQIDDFTTSEALLQSQGYSVERYPEATYTLLAEDIVPGAPGLATYSTQSRIGLLRLQLTDATPAEYGLTSNARAQRALGINANDSIAGALRAQGFQESPRFRFDTRHEVAAHADVGRIRATPWVVGRLTAYDDDFAEFGPGTADPTRLWGAAGLTLATTVQRVIDGVYSRAFDINRLRHIVQPSVTVFHAGTNTDQDELPVYDEAVESLADGTVFRLGLDQTFQTKRGGPGRWFNADLVTLDAELVFVTNDARGESSIGRFDQAMPELSRLTDFGSLAATWQATDSIAVVGGAIYDFDRGRQSLTTGGVLLDHGLGLRSYLRYRHLNDQDSTLLSAGLGYELSDKYRVDSSVTFDTEESDLQDISAEISRDFQSAVFGLGVSYNNISESTSVNVLFQPLGRGTASRIGTDGVAPDRTGAALGG
jgi:hypothetical protein